MPPSFRTIDYALRPAKHTERRMLCDIYRKLSTFSDLTEYTYAGFGGIAFSDFTMFHKALGVINMISFEQSQSSTTKTRLESNKPFNTIKIINDSSSKELPKLKWDEPHLIWLDYDDPLLPNMLLDAGIVSQNASSGTAFTISFQCNAAPEMGEDIQNQVDTFTSNFGVHRVPPGTDELDLAGWSYGKLGCKMIEAEIESSLALRNLSLMNEDQIKFRKICTIKYKDNAKMVTLVGLFVAHKDAEVFKNCNFSSLDFLPTTKEVKIDIPPLTIKEIKDLEAQLPLKSGERMRNGHIPLRDANQFAKLYRYLPNFSVLEN